MTWPSSAAHYTAAPTIAVVMSGWPRISETFALNELIALRRAGMLTAILATKRGDPRLRQPGHAELDDLVTVLPDAPAARQAEIVAEQLSGADVSAVHGYFAHHPTEVAERAAHLLGVPFGFSAHALDARKVDAAELRRRARAAAWVVTCNTETLATLHSCGATAELIPHGVDLTEFDARLRPTTGGQLLAVGRLVDKKGFAVLIDALGLLSQRLGPAAPTLRIVGDGPLRAELVARADSRRVGALVEFAGCRTHAELPDLYRAAAVVVVPSVIDGKGDRDGLPNVVLEAMASGCAIVASDVAAISDAVAGSDEAGVLVPPGDPAQLAEALATLLADPARRAALGATARRVAEQRFELGRCSDRLAQLLCDVLARRAA